MVGMQKSKAPALWFEFPTLHNDKGGVKSPVDIVVLIHSQKNIKGKNDNLAIVIYSYCFLNIMFISIKFSCVLYLHMCESKNRERRSNARVFS
jgi:hypothetical protein